MFCTSDGRMSHDLGRLAVSTFLVVLVVSRDDVSYFFDVLSVTSFLSPAFLG